jgi:ABC-type transport system involved in cytochrome c biogenesis permease subunit
VNHIPLIVKSLIGLGIALYCGSGILSVLRKNIASWVLFAIAWLCNTGLFALNWIGAGVPPFGNMYHVLTFLALCFLPFAILFVTRTQRSGLAAYFAAGAALFLAGTLFMDTSIDWQQMPALQSGWFVPHVASYIVSYSLAAVGFILTVQSFIKSRLAGKPETGPTLGDASYQIVLFAFPFMSFGLFSGALWAEQAWGTFWSWDIKETWSLITWSLYIIYFHARRTDAIKAWSPLIQVLAFCALLVTFFVVNLMPAFSGGLHSYV